MNSSIRTAFLAMAACVAIVLVSAAEQPASPTTRTPPALSWTPCRNGLQCATLTVPVDYHHPGGSTLSLAVIRRPATDPASRIGSLVVDPGGPGVSGLAFLRNRPAYFRPEIRARFDLVSFDPRGVGASDQVHCRRQPYDPPGPLPMPPTQQALDQIAEAHRNYGLTCRALTGPLAEHADTASTARDLDRLRGALGQAKLNYYGVSYGTMLGVTYAQLFPDRVGRMVLDSVEDHSRPYFDNVTEQARARQAAFEALAAFADHPSTTLPQSGNFTTRYRQLVRRADTSPIPAPHAIDPTPVTGTEIEFAVYAALAKPAGWPAIITALTEAEHGDASTIRRSLAGFTDTDALASVRAIACSDFPVKPVTATALAPLTRRLLAISPTQARGVLTDQLRCYGWPLPAADPPDPAPALLHSKVLILATIIDPITPYPSALRAQRQLPGSILLTYHGIGHGVYGTCFYLTQATDHYLIDYSAHATPGKR